MLEKKVLTLSIIVSVSIHCRPVHRYQLGCFMTGLALFEPARPNNNFTACLNRLELLPSDDADDTAEQQQTQGSRLGNGLTRLGRIGGAPVGQHFDVVVSSDELIAGGDAVVVWCAVSASPYNARAGLAPVAEDADQVVGTDEIVFCDVTAILGCRRLNAS